MVSPSGTTPDCSIRTRMRRPLRLPVAPWKPKASTWPVPLSARYMVAPSGLPADAVGDGQAGQHGRAGAVELQPVERARPGRFIVGHRAGPEAALRVAGPIVHPQIARRRCQAGPDAARPG